MLGALLRQWRRPLQPHLLPHLHSWRPQQWLLPSGRCSAPSSPPARPSSSSSSSSSSHDNPRLCDFVTSLAPPLRLQSFLYPCITPLACITRSPCLATLPHTSCIQPLPHASFSLYCASLLPTADVPIPPCLNSNTQTRSGGAAPSRTSGAVLPAAAYALPPAFTPPPARMCPHVSPCVGAENQMCRKHPSTRQLDCCQT